MERTVDAIMKKTMLIMSCEHATSSVPGEYTHLFEGHQAVLKTHRAADWGAEEMALYFARELTCPLTQATVTRLLIDCNRSLNHPACFSEFTRMLPESDKQKLAETYYHPYRSAIEGQIAAAVRQGVQVLHLAVHTFTPELNGVVRQADIGLLYDSVRCGEKEVARQWKNLLFTVLPDTRVRKNYPYQGRSDGFTSALRKRYDESCYLGIELEVNQAITTRPELFQRWLPEMTYSLKELLLLL